MSGSPQEAVTAFNNNKLMPRTHQVLMPRTHPVPSYALRNPAEFDKIWSLAGSRICAAAWPSPDKAAVIAFTISQDQGEAKGVRDKRATDAYVISGLIKSGKVTVKKGGFVDSKTLLPKGRGSHKFK